MCLEVALYGLGLIAYPVGTESEVRDKGRTPLFCVCQAETQIFSMILWHDHLRYHFALRKFAGISKASGYSRLLSAGEWVCSPIPLSNSKGKLMGKHYGKTGNPAQRADMRAKAYALSLKGMSNVAIGDELGVSRETIRTLLAEYIAEISVPIAEKARAVELDKLDRLEAVAWKVLDDRHIAFQHGKVVVLDGKPIEDVEPVFKSMDRIVKISERRSRYLGLDMPTKSEHTVTTGSPVDASSRALVEEMEAANQADRDHAE